MRATYYEDNDIIIPFNKVILVHKDRENDRVVVHMSEPDSQVNLENAAEKEAFIASYRKYLAALNNG